jgi:EAL domain-containing protein (putative c-di-GMP-specific phosphodiesterase class I)
MARGLLSDLRADLAGNALELAYQPKHTLDGRVVGVEALLRWRHRRYGELSPAVAISLAEDSGDIHPLGYWMLEIAALGRAQDIVMIAEFVETQAQRDLLGELGCDCFQGHFHSPALGENECLDYFRIHH